MGSMSGAWIVGGRKGVGVDAGEQAEAKTRLKTAMNRSRWSENRLSLKSRLIIKKGDPAGRPNRAFIHRIVSPRDASLILLLPER